MFRKWASTSKVLTKVITDEVFAATRLTEASECSC